MDLGIFDSRYGPNQDLLLAFVRTKSSCFLKRSLNDRESWYVVYGGTMYCLRMWRLFKETNVSELFLAGSSNLRSVEISIPNHRRILGLAHELWYRILQSC
jgi:hypothetical protein